MFKSWTRTRDIITIFHSPSSPSSIRVLNLLKQASAAASENATIDQASDHSAQNKIQRDGFDLDVQEAPPTKDQLKSIFEYLGAKGPGGLVKGAGSESEAVRLVGEKGESFVRPVIVDWNNGRVVTGESESEIVKMLNDGAK